MDKKTEILNLTKKSTADGVLLETASNNICEWVESGIVQDWALSSILELFEKKAYEELNDRFFKTIEFGTGGMRGRTIAKNSASFEIGNVSSAGTPEHAAIGSNCMNDINVARATMGLFKYCKKWCDENSLGAPSLVIAHDVRHFSRHFCELAASVWARLGGIVKIFDGSRSTPQLSYTVIRSGSTAGIVITASHNPSCDNGYKVYFSDGAQIAFQHADGVVEAVKSINLSEVKDFLDVDLSNVKVIEKDLETSYIKSLDDCVIDKDIMRKNPPKIVFTPVHGTGAVLCPEIMRHFGLEPILQEEQMVMDPRFPTVKQPNPEYAETLSMAISLAKDTEAECVVATDPDADRMGVAFRAKNGEIKLLTGNMIGSLLCDYRISKMIEHKIVTKPENSAIVKTFVTSPLQDAIASSYGIKCINALTGFKWIGAKLRDYQEELERKVQGIDYLSLSYLEKAKLLQENSTFFVFGGEESYGFLGTDSVRDKDANMAVIMFSELVASLKSQNKSIDEYLDEIYLKNGYFLEDLKSVYKEGASGSAYIKGFLNSLENSPLESVGGVKVANVLSFAKDDIFDADGKKIAKEKFFFYKLENGYSFAIRASGTEPKIKFYAFACEKVGSLEELGGAKAEARKNLTALLNAIEDIFNSYKA